MATHVDPNDTVAAILSTHRSAARVLLSHRMHCVGCAIAPFETLAEACAIYGVSLAEILTELEAAWAQEDNR